MDLRKCVRCGLSVSAGACDDPPLVFHDRPEQCIAALITRLGEARAALREMSSLLCSQGIKEWRMTNAGRVALAIAAQESTEPNSVVVGRPVDEYRRPGQ